MATSVSWIPQTSPRVLIPMLSEHAKNILREKRERPSLRAISKFAASSRVAAGLRTTSDAVLVVIATSLARSLAPANGAGQLRITGLETGLAARA